MLPVGVLATAGLLLPALARAASDPDAPTLVRQPGRCAMRDSCGRKGAFGGEIPCPDNGPATAHDDDALYTATLAQVCGDDFSTTTCCTQGQIETLQASLAQAEPLIASCPACRNNFRRFYCEFTCSPDQSLFLAVTATQTLPSSSRKAVASVDMSVSDRFGAGFFDSCKGVKFGATNGYAMDLLGGGATDWLAFLRYMGQERALGSPFQINFPSPSDPPLSPARSASASPPSPPPAAPTPLDLDPISCSSPDPSQRCACPDCPPVCAALPPVLSPHEQYERRCRVGRMDCFPFALAVLYAVALVGALGAWGAREARNRWTGGGAGGAIRLGEDDDDIEGTSEFGGSSAATHGDEGASWAHALFRRASALLLGSRAASSGRADRSVRGAGRRSRAGSSPSTRSSTGGGLVGARSIASELDGSGGSSSQSPRRPQPSPSSSSTARASSHTHHTQHTDGSRGASLMLDAAGEGAALQPRTYALNTALSGAFYRLGRACASRPYLVLALGLALCGLANAGWGRFEVERDPVELWVPRGSEVRSEKERFDEAFGPFYRTEQVFFSVRPARSRGVDDERNVDDEEGDAEGREAVKWQPVDEPVLSWDTLNFLLSVESDIRSLRTSPSNLSLASVCFAPTSASGTATSADECVVQSPLGYFSNSLDALTPETWASALDDCATSPALCLPPFGQPLNPKLVLGGVPGGAQAHGARAVILTYVVTNSLDPAAVARAEEWEAVLAAYLRGLASPAGAAAQHGLRVSWSVGTSLEAELNAATNTDVPVVVVSYIAMFLYVAVSLGGSASGLLRTAARAGMLLLAAALSAARWTARKVRQWTGGAGGGAIKLDDEDHLPGLGAAGAGRSAGFEQTLTGGSASGLGAYFRRQVLVDSKFMLGLWGIVIVLLSVSTSVALCSAAGVKVTLIIAEVIPFLVLAIGVDNVFLLSHELDEQNARSYRHGSPSFLLPGEDETEDDEIFLSAEERVARTLARVGPSILLSASCETVAFALGALVGMPAVRNFAIYAAGAVVVNALLQVTIFISLMTLDLRRVEANRMDCFPCFKLPAAATFDIGAAVSESLLSRFVRRVYAPNLVRKPVKFLVLALFSGLFVLSWIGARHIDLGLDQRLALPSSSYLVDYFNAVDEYLDVGPPVYFVAEGLNATALPNIRHLCSRFSTCDDYSLANVLEAERKRSESSYLAEPPAVWIDDFISWTNPILEDCCRVKRRDSSQFCGPNDPEAACKPCFEDREPAWSTTLEGFPQDGEMMRFVEQWLASPTDESCPLGGKAGYSSALALSDDRGNIDLSHFRTYHTPLKTQDDFINAFAAARRIAKDLSKRTGAKVFPYSLFYVFFSSYGEIWATTREVLTFALAAVFLVTSLILGSFRTGCVVAFTVFLSLVSVMGAMGVWGVSLNPLSLVNLVISVGISVEFCAHLARAFMGALGGGLPFHHPAGPKDRDERAVAALEDVGASVVSGIGATKLIGIAVLGLTSSALLKTYYFKMWLALILSSALHGLVLLPVLLSIFGGQGYALTTQDSDGGWIETSVQRRYARENRTFIDDDADSVDSEGF
ncbi:sphingolipid transporter [Rhodotorula paludigena]|uniref:sphingolipid transporter n=1 Tax=Rhodotorula paludigena TaxID=86838 RepID=UPI003173478C